MFGRGNSTDVTDMDLQQLQSDTSLERDNAEKNRYQENFYISESSTFQQQPEPEMKVEHQFPEVCSDSRSVRKPIKILKDRIRKQKMADKVADMESLIWLDHRMKTLPQVNQTKTPLQADLQVNTQNIKNIDNYLRGNSTDPTEMDPEQLPSDMPFETLERYNVEKNWYLENFYISESSTSQQQPESEMKVEHQFPEVCSDSRSVRKRMKILKDRIHRQKMADKRTDLELLLWVKLKLKAFPVSLQIPASFNQIRNEWPMRPDLQIILQKMQDIKAKSKDRVLTENDMNGELGIVIQELDTLRARRLKEQERDLDAVLGTDMGTKNLIEKFSSEFPWLFSQDQVQESLSTLGAQFKSLENQLYDKNNNKVSFKDFEGLEEALKKTNGLDLLPGYLKPIANQIEKAHGEATGIAHEYIQLFVCAAINEMQESAVKSLNWDTLKKWGATLNYARQLGFQVSLADELLRKTFVAYMCFKFLINQPDDKKNNQVSDEDLESQVYGSWSTFGAEFKSLENQHYEENNNKVSFKDFEGLEEALEKNNAFGLPDYLKPIVNQIEKARGEATGIAHACIQHFVCAAIKEMQDSALESLNWDTLEKWGATLNYARQLGFQVSFADELLRKTFVTYMYFKFLINQPDDKKNNQVSDEDLESQVCGSWSTFGAEFKSLENQLYEENNTKVSFKDFEGLEEALKKTNAFGLPDYLKPIANQIEEARGKAAGLDHGCIQILVCAAIKEMQDSALESLNWDTLKKWGGTLNCARQLGFQVSFADELLRKTLVAYMCFKFLINQPDDKNNNQGKFR
ncbi:hypothetical protein ES288_A11G385300v1 [Gossypium darwinii]|uniref:Uncharacterized protein n=1 Tax=Gossypium darwinii TaxID=34276 RepID=A0A5D2EVJ9_GOSDA|nr:hypothetical protein ES288_A11G385300v1 [Gossypium darwinii]